MAFFVKLTTDPYTTQVAINLELVTRCVPGVSNKGTVLHLVDGVTVSVKEDFDGVWGLCSDASRRP
jgi:hypothetical protein